MKRILASRLAAAGVPFAVAGLLWAGVRPACAQANGGAAADSGALGTAVPAPAAAAPAVPVSASAIAAPAVPAPAATGLWRRATLLGDAGGLRPALAARGVTIGLQETDEYLNNLSGGVQRGGAYDGLAQFDIGIDTQKAFGLPGGTFNVSALQIRGGNLSASNLMTLQSASGIEADSSTRLWELWYQQSLAGGRIDLKVGQQSADQEFMTSQYATVFMNATFGWSIVPSADLPSGGPAYPLAAPGVRVRATPTGALTVLAGVFDANPAAGAGDPQRLNRYGTNFGVGDGALVIGEVQYALDAPPADASAARSTGLPGTYKAGFWYSPQSASQTSGPGGPRAHRSDYSVYAVADQMVWRPAADSPRSVGVFARAMEAPGGRSPVDLGVNAGVALKAPFAGRDNDVAGLAFSYAHVGSSAQYPDGGGPLFVHAYPARSAETLVEATYAYQVAPWWQWQADVQYVLRPSGGIPDPAKPSARVGNEAIVGVRSTLTF